MDGPLSEIDEFLPVISCYFLKSFSFCNQKIYILSDKTLVRTTTKCVFSQISLHIFSVTQNFSIIQIRDSILEVSHLLFFQALKSNTKSNLFDMAIMAGSFECSPCFYFSFQQLTQANLLLCSSLHYTNEQVHSALGRILRL